VGASTERPDHDTDDHEVRDMDDHEHARRRPDPWAPSRPRIEGLVASCADYLGRITRSLKRDTDAHYVTDKAHQLRNAATSLVDACHEATLDARRCGAAIERTFADGEAYTDECTLPRGHRGDHDARNPATPIERALAEANELAYEARRVADLLAWVSPGGYDAEDLDDLEQGLRTVGRSLDAARSAVAALRAGDAGTEPAEDLP
jgi:hypothetical protein